ncbi:RNA polymerase sigma-70 factor, ECF subfamily [Pedobacter sp. ok626]|nr:RNA polymerase sigma-70 factor, ECF subfamily [Pedobacter sp. ok626]
MLTNINKYFLNNLVSNEKSSFFLQKIAAGDHSVFKELFMEYFPKVKCFITHLIKDEVIAEELSQDVFVKVWEHREKLAQIQLLGSYIYKIAKNITLDHIARKSKEKLFVDGYQPDAAYTIEGDLYARETELLIQLTVNIMPPQRKKVYEMSRTQGLNNDEIAEQLALSKKTVENHLNLALKEIRKTIQLIALFF